MEEINFFLEESVASFTARSKSQWKSSENSSAEQ
jgi:hypothetical protein